MEPIGPGMPLEKWLERRWMGRFANILVEHGLKDLVAIHAATSSSEADRQKVIKLFEKPGHRLKIRLLLDELAAAFAPKPSEPAPAPPAAAAVAEEEHASSVVPPLPAMPTGEAPVPPSDLPPVPSGELLSPRGHEEYEIESESSSESSGSDDEAEEEEEAHPAPHQASSASAVAADAFDDLPPPPVPAATAVSTPAPAAVAPARPVAPPPPPPGSKSPPPPVPPVPPTVPSLPQANVTLSPPPAQPASLPAFPDSDDSDSDEEPGEAPAAEPTPGAAVPAAHETHTDKDTVAPLPVHDPADKPAPANRVLQQSESFRKRQEAFLAQASQNASPAAPKPPISLGAGAGAGIKPSDAFKNKAAGIGAALAGAMARGPPVFKKPVAAAGQEEEEQPPPVPLLPSARPHGIPAGAMAMPGFAPAPTAHSPPPPPSQAKSPPPIPDSHKPPPPASAAPSHSQPPPSTEEMHRLRVNTMLSDLMGASGLLGPEDGGPETEYKLPLTSSLTNPDKTGILEKRGTQLLNQVWKARYFILKGADLFWLKSKQDKQPSGMIHLTERGLIVSSPEDRLIEIFTARKTYLLRAATASEQGDWLAAIRDAQSRFSDDPSAIKDMTATIVTNQAAHRASMASIDPNEAEVARLMKMLKDGSMFVKYKHKKGHERMIWCPSSLDRILWADDMQRKKVKGYIMMADVVRITEGCFGSKRNENAFTVISNERTLELEARSIGEKNDWMTALNYLTQVRRK